MVYMKMVEHTNLHNTIDFNSAFMLYTRRGEFNCGIGFFMIHFVYKLLTIDDFQWWIIEWFQLYYKPHKWNYWFDHDAGTGRIRHDWAKNQTYWLLWKLNKNFSINRLRCGNNSVFWPFPGIKLILRYPAK